MKEVPVMVWVARNLRQPLGMSALFSPKDRLNVSRRRLSPHALITSRENRGQANKLKAARILLRIGCQVARDEEKRGSSGNITASPRRGDVCEAFRRGIGSRAGWLRFEQWKDEL